MLGNALGHRDARGPDAVPLARGHAFRLLHVGVARDISDDAQKDQRLKVRGW